MKTDRFRKIDMKLRAMVRKAETTNQEKRALARIVKDFEETRVNATTIRRRPVKG